MDKREVLMFLNQLGYTGISAQDLKSFMHDLKKVIKYDSKNITCNSYSCNDSDNKTNYSSYIEASSSLGDDEDSEVLERLRLRPPHRNVFEELYKTDTVASKARICAPKKPSTISLEIRRKPMPGMENASVQVTPSVSRGCSAPQSLEPSSVRNFTAEAVSFPPCKHMSPKKTTTTCSLRPKSSFIRPKLAPKLPKHDPVALYQKYQSEWKKLKIPGESNHSELRWAIREHLMG